MFYNRGHHLGIQEGDLVMKISTILFASPMAKEIEHIFNSKKVAGDKQFRFRTEEEVTEDDYKWADAFIAFKRPANFSFGNIKWVHSFGAGVDKILKDIDWKEDVLLTRTVCSFGQRMSEYCLSYILRDVQNHSCYEKMQAEKEWKLVAPTPLQEKQAVVYGTGVIGREVAETLASFGMTVYGVSLSGTQKEPFRQIFSSKEPLNDALAEADYVINTMPLTDETKKVFNKDVLARWTDAVFINVGRGESVDNEALLQALDNGHIRQAVLDVFESEPLPQDDPFWSHPKVIVTPHISAVTTPEEGVDCFLNTLYKLENGETVGNAVDLNQGF